MKKVQKIIHDQFLSQSCNLKIVLFGGCLIICHFLPKLNINNNDNKTNSVIEGSVNLGLHNGDFTVTIYNLFTITN